MSPAVVAATNVLLLVGVGELCVGVLVAVFVRHPARLLGWGWIAGGVLSCVAALAARL